MTDKHDFTVIRRSGRPAFDRNVTYFSVLEDVYAEMLGAGSTWDAPEMLLMDGKLVIDGGLADVAHDYGTRKIELRAEANDKVRSLFTPDWLKRTENAT